MRVNSQTTTLPVLSPPQTSASLKSTPAKSQPSNTEKLMDELKNKYKNIHFDFISFENDDQLKKYVSSKRGLNNVAIDPALLEKMANDDTVRARVESVLSMLDNYRFSSQVQAQLMDKRLTGMGLVLDENGEVSKWTVMEEPKKPDFYYSSLNKDDHRWSQFYQKRKNPKMTTYKYSHSRSMASLASAKNVSSVRGLIASKNREIQKVKLQVSDPAEAASIIRQIKSVIRSGNIKIARLHKEERLYQQQKIAAKKMKVKLEKQLAEELRRKRTARKAQERCQSDCMEDIFSKPSVNDYRYKEICEQYAETMSGYTGAVSGTAAAGTPAVSAEAASSAAQITVTSVASIDCSV